MKIDYSAWRFWWDVGITILLGANALFTWLSTRTKANAAEIGDARRELALVREEMRSMDERLKAAIGHSDLRPIYERMNSMDKQLGEISGKLHTLDLIHEYLMNKGGKA